VLNPAAFTHYSYALADAAALVTKAGLKLIEVHISNPHAREEFRHKSVISGVATGVIAGFGTESYKLAIQAI
jgi:3-dehydroquinate dehydratase-2